MRRKTTTLDWAQANLGELRERTVYRERAFSWLPRVPVPDGYDAVRCGCRLTLRGMNGHPYWYEPCPLHEYLDGGP